MRKTMTEARKTTSFLMVQRLLRVQRAIHPMGREKTAATIHLFSPG